MTKYTKQEAEHVHKCIKEKTTSINKAAENLRDGSPVELGYLLEKTEDLLRFLEREFEVQNGHKTEHALKLMKYETIKLREKTKKHIS